MDMRVLNEEELEWVAGGKMAGSASLMAKRAENALKTLVPQAAPEINAVETLEDTVANTLDDILPF